MKKLMLNVLLAVAAIFQVSAQIDDSKMTLPIESTTASRAAIAKIDCKCENNILKDGGFQGLTNAPSSSNIGTSSMPWQINTLSPQWTPVAAACNNGYIQMWGNQAVFESVKQQSVSLAASTGYQLKVTAKHFSPTALGNVVRLRVKFIGSPAIPDVVTPNFPTSWTTFPVPFTSGATAGTYTVVLQPENNHNVNNGAYVSWIQVDNICLEKACNCEKLPNQFAIAGQKFFCKPKTCSNTFTYTAPAMPATGCYTYSWAVSPSVAFTGQGTNQINFNCAALSPGTYTIAVKISCGGKTVSSTTTLVVCAKPDPAFAMATNGSGVIMTPSASASGHFWVLVKDNDNSCNYSSGDAIIATSALLTPSFAGLANNQQYTIYHFAYNNCGGQYCFSLQIMCFKYLPPMRAAAGTAPTAQVQRVSEKLVDDLKTVHADVLKQLPADVKQQVDRVDTAGRD